MSTTPTTSFDRAALPAAGTVRGRASWSGLLRLSLVSVPVKAYPATATTAETHCHQLHADCGQRIRYVKQCPVHGPVETGAIVSGYPYAQGQYVVIDDDQLDQLRAPADRALCLERFLDVADFDPVLFAGRSLYLVPDGVVAHHPYAVLGAALREKRKLAVGRIVMSGYRRLVLIRPTGAVLGMHVLHYPAQVRPAATWEAQLRPTPVADSEKNLAGQLIDAHTQPVNWSEYRDDRTEQLAILVQAALDQRPPIAAPAEPVPILSLVEALQQSVAAALKQPPPSVVANGHPRMRTGKPRSLARRRA
jgi:DNA end-binding protein Ku